MKRKTVKVCDHYQKEIFQPAGPYIPVQILKIELASLIDFNCSLKRDRRG